MTGGAERESSPRSFLIVRLGALGDVVHAIPVVAALRHAYPGARIGWIVHPRFAPLLHLVDTMQSAERGDYSRRAEVTSDDEIGHLMRGFNLMLSKIENR